jgi:hypothetical protein
MKINEYNCLSTIFHPQSTHKPQTGIVNRQLVTFLSHLLNKSLHPTRSSSSLYLQIIATLLLWPMTPVPTPLWKHAPYQSIVMFLSNGMRMNRPITALQIWDISTGRSPEVSIQCLSDCREIPVLDWAVQCNHCKRNQLKQVFGMLICPS